MRPAFHPFHAPVRDSRSRLSGFTLIEVMVVIVVIGIMAAIVAPKILAYPDIARHKAAKASIKTLSNVLALYQLEEGSFPTTEQGLEALIKPAATGTSTHPPWGYIDREDLTDPWGNDYLYVSPGQHGSFDLSSYGKDGIPGGDGVNSDLSNW